MARSNVSDLLAFIAVARERSFTRAAAKLGVSQSALSHTVRGLESRLGLRLLNRTTRSVSPTQAGERLLVKAAPHFAEIEAELAALSQLRDKPAGTIRITSGDHAAGTVLWPALACAFSKTGARRFRAITSTTRAGARPRRHLPCSSTRCATAAERRSSRRAQGTHLSRSASIFCRRRSAAGCVQSLLNSAGSQLP